MGMTLLQLQRRMAEDVRRPLAPGFGMQSETEDGDAISDRAQRYIKPNDRLTSFERLEIYNRQYWFRITASLEEDYPALLAVLGTKRFDKLAVEFLSAIPSTSFTLRNLGAQLPEWLTRHPELTYARRQLLVDVAQLEWAYIEAFDSASKLPLSLSDMQELGPQSTLSLQPHLQLLSLRYPVDELVLAVRRDTQSLEVSSNAVIERGRKKSQRLPRMSRAQVYLVVHRFADAVYYRRVDREAFLLLAALKQKVPLAAALEQAFKHSSCSAANQAVKAGQYFEHASELGWFC